MAETTLEAMNELIAIMTSVQEKIDLALVAAETAITSWDSMQTSLDKIRKNMDEKVKPAPKKLKIGHVADGRYCIEKKVGHGWKKYDDEVFNTIEEAQDYLDVLEG